jgi:small subunit ribosomal protein S8
LVTVGLFLIGDTQMSMNDPLADMLTRIRNAVQAGHTSLMVPSSRSKQGIAKVLYEEGYIAGSHLETENGIEHLHIQLKYGEKGVKVITNITRVSKPGLRRYKKVKELSDVLNGFGIAILTTSKGIMTDLEARRQNIGGEIICEVW